MANTLEAVFRLTDQYTATMQKIMQSTDSYEKRQQQARKATEQLKNDIRGIKSSSDTAASGIGAVTTRIAGLVSAAYMGKKALDLMFSAIKTGAQMQVQKNTFEALLGNDAAGDALYRYTQQYGKEKSVLGPLGISSATTSFLPFTRDIDKLTQLYQLTERLYSRDPTQGMEGAVFAMKELMSGDVMSARERFNISGISGEKIREFANNSDIAGAIGYLDQMFNRFGATQEVVDKNFTSLSTQAEIFKNNVVAAMGDEASPAVQSLSILMQQLNADMDAGKFAPFFNLVANGAVAVGNALSWLAQNATTLVPVIGGVVTALVIFNTAMGLAKTYATVTGATISIVAGNWITAAAIIAGAAATIGLSMALTQENDNLKKTADSLTKAKSDYASTLKNAGISTKVPVEIANKDPISVKGQVEIEKESQKYLFDLAAQKAIATFNMQQVTPRVDVHIDRVEKTADMEEVANYLGDVVAENSGRQAQGAYG